MVRKVLLTVFVVFWFEKSAAQIVGTMFITAGYLAVLQQTKPYVKDSDDVLAILLQWPVNVCAELCHRT